MNSFDVKEKLTEIFRDVLDDDNFVLLPELKASDVPQWDSLNHMRLILSIERDFGFKLSALEVSHLKNVGDLISMVESKQSNRV